MSYILHFLCEPIRAIIKLKKYNLFNNFYCLNIWEVNYKIYQKTVVYQKIFIKKNKNKNKTMLRDTANRRSEFSSLPKTSFRILKWVCITLAHVSWATGFLNVTCPQVHTLRNFNLDLNVILKNASMGKALSFATVVVVLLTWPQRW